MVGSAIVRELERQGYQNILMPTREELDLLWQDDVDQYFIDNKPEYVFHCAAKVGGVLENSQNKSAFLNDNIMISFNVIRAAHNFGVKKLVNMGSACIYPKITDRPIKEEDLLSGYLESTNEGYALAKIAALKLCDYYNKEHNTNFLSIMPCNLYGINDKSTHVIPDLIRRFHSAKINNEPFVECYGNGTPLREFLHVDDCAKACIQLMEKIDAQLMMDCGSSWFNVGSGHDITIQHLVDIIRFVVGYEGSITWNGAKPNGVQRRLLDSSRIKYHTGWLNTKDFIEGIKEYYQSNNRLG